MYYRVRTRLADTPGSLALLARHCGDAGVNILALQIHPELGAVIDDLVVETPDAWTAAAVIQLVSGAGGDEVSVVPCATHDLVDQPTVWLRAAMAPTSVVEYDVTDSGVVARIGRRLLRQLSGVAAARGGTELVLVAPASEEGVVPLLAASGMRGRIRLTEDGLSVHVSLAGVRPIEALADR